MTFHQLHAYATLKRRVMANIVNDLQLKAYKRNVEKSLFVHMYVHNVFYICGLNIFSLNCVRFVLYFHF